MPWNKLDLSDEQRRERRRQKARERYKANPEKYVRAAVEYKRRKNRSDPNYVPRPPKMPDDVRIEKERARCREKYPRYYRENRDDVRAKAVAKYHRTKEASPVIFLRRAAKFRAKKKGLPFDLTLRYCEALWTGRCAITNLPMRASKGRFGPSMFSPSIDRIVPDRGYVPGNIRFVLHAVNSMKNDGTDADMVMIARAIVTNFSASPGR